MSPLYPSLAPSKDVILDRSQGPLGSPHEDLQVLNYSEVEWPLPLSDFYWAHTSNKYPIHTYDLALCYPSARRWSACKIFPFSLLLTKQV